jgi:hypothetical protein
VEHTVEPQVEVQLSRRRSAAAAAWNLTAQVVLIGSGDLISIPGRADLTYPFRPHTEYYYLTDSELPGGWNSPRRLGPRSACGSASASMASRDGRRANLAPG